MFIKSIMPVDDGTMLVATDSDGDQTLIPLVCWGIIMDSETMHDSITGFVYVNGQAELLPVTELDQHDLQFVGYGTATYIDGVNSD